MALGHFSHVEYGALNWSLTACGIIQSSDMVRVVQYCRMKVFLTAVLSYHGVVLCGCHSMIVAWTTITPWHGVVWVPLHDSSLDRDIGRAANQPFTCHSTQLLAVLVILILILILILIILILVILILFLAILLKFDQLLIGRCPFPMFSQKPFLCWWLPRVLMCPL